MWPTGVDTAAALLRPGVVVVVRSDCSQWIADPARVGVVKVPEVWSMNGMPKALPKGLKTKPPMLIGQEGGNGS